MNTVILIYHVVLIYTVNRKMPLIYSVHKALIMSKAIASPRIMTGTVILMRPDGISMLVSMLRKDSGRRSAKGERSSGERMQVRPK